MKQYQIYFDNNEKLHLQFSRLKEEIQKNSFSDITFYITWTQSEKSKLEFIIKEIEKCFPESAYYGNQASGSISMGEFASGINITCYAFEGKTTRTELVWVEKETEISSLEDLWNYCNTKSGLCGIELIPAFSYLEILKIDRNIPDVDSNILIFGGASSNFDVSSYNSYIIAKGHSLTKNGMAVMLYYGTDLKFQSFDILGWKGLGNLMKVTRSKGKELFEIDNVPAFSIYEKYLNLTLEDKDTLVFPLIAEEDGNEFIRTPQVIRQDKTMLMFADIPEGTHVRISYGDKNTILNRLNDRAIEVAEYNPEAIKAYSCAGRRIFWGNKEVGKETSILQKIAPVTGFYTGGEILRFGKRLRVLNQTLALVLFREGKEKQNQKIVIKHDEDKSLLSRLTYFAERIVDEEMEAKSQLSEALKKAEVANTSKTNFLFNMSHDIRTPMNAINGFSAIARKHSDDSVKVKDCLDKIDISSQQLLTLINQVLEMARIESGKIEFQNNLVDINKEFDSMITILNEQAKTSKINFKYSIKNINHNFILTDEARMSSVTMNIVGNAMKYTPQGGTVEFNFCEIKSRKPGYATFVLTVTDTGIGMSKEFLKKMYEPFSREKNTTVSKIQGTGLGLSIVKNVIDLLGGDIEVQSEIGKGTRFDITLDFQIADVLVEEKEEENILISFEGKRALLVEDNEMNREIARDILEDQNLKIEYAEDGNVAVEMIKHLYEKGEYKYYDFILMDVQMPLLNGYEATKEIRKLEKGKNIHIPIIAMTANAFEEDRQNAFAAGMDEHLAKPIQVQKLLKIISKFL